MKPDPDLLKILVVEDHVDTRTALGMMLQRSGHSPTLVSTLGEGIAALSAKPFDVVISDIELPDGSGWDLIRKGGTKAIGVAISGHESFEDPRKRAQSGFRFFLKKPFRISELRAVLDNVTK